MPLSIVIPRPPRHLGIHTILFPDDSAASGAPLNDSLVSEANRIADKVIAVGTAIAGPPPHRSVQEELPP